MPHENRAPQRWDLNKNTNYCMPHKNRAPQRWDLNKTIITVCHTRIEHHKGGI